MVSLFLQHALTVEGARITYPDKMASNGIIHRIEKVLMPPVGTIVDVLTKDGSFNTLLAAGEVTPEVCEGWQSVAGTSPS